MLAEAQEARISAGAAAERVGVTRLVLTDFRNYREARLTLGTEPVVLTGPNGAGKTNLLEALSFLAPGRGLRGAKLTEIDRRSGSEGDFPDSGWAVAAVVATRRGALRLGTGRDAAASERRIVRIDGEPARGQSALGERLGNRMADAADGSALSRRSERPAAVSRSAGARPRPGACLARRRLRAGPARALAPAAGWPRRPGVAGGARGGDGGARASRSRRAGATPCSGSTALAPKPKAHSRAPG